MTGHQIVDHPNRRWTDQHPIGTNRARTAERILLPLIGASVMALAAAILWVTTIRPEPFQPLDYTLPQQIVEVTSDGRAVVPMAGAFDEPSVFVGDPVPVQSSLCVNHDQPVRVRGEVYWNRLSPRGFDVLSGQGSRTLEPGCITTQFSNDMPDEVMTDVVEAGEPELWQISGQVWIDEPNGGATSWVTERFWIVP